MGATTVERRLRLSSLPAARPGKGRSGAGIFGLVKARAVEIEEAVQWPMAGSAAFAPRGSRYSEKEPEQMARAKAVDGETYAYSVMFEPDEEAGGYTVLKPRQVIRALERADFFTTISPAVTVRFDIDAEGTFASPSGTTTGTFIRRPCARSSDRRGSASTSSST
jgi:hypothetical protein